MDRDDDSVAIDVCVTIETEEIGKRIECIRQEREIDWSDQ
jgi:hypothetical protein